MIPLYYIIRESDTVNVVAPPMMRGKAYSKDHGCMEKKITMRDFHTHPHFKEDNPKVY